MDIKKLNICVECASELISRIKNYKLEIKKDIDEGYTEFGAMWNPKATGSIRRQSMELTRTLADLRRLG